MGIWSCTFEKVDFEKNAFKVLKCPFSWAVMNFQLVMDKNATFWYGINCFWKRRVCTIHFRQKVIFYIFDFFLILAYISLSVTDDMVPFYMDTHVFYHISQLISLFKSYDKFRFSLSNNIDIDIWRVSIKPLALYFHFETILLPSNEADL